MQEDELSGEDILNLTTKKDIFKQINASKIWSIIMAIITIIVIFLCLSIVCFKSRYTISEVSGQSMQNTFNANSTSSNDENNEMVIYCLQKTYDRGDVIIYDHEGTLVIKRIIALGGDRLKVTATSVGFMRTEYKFYLNGEIIEEPYLDEEHSDMSTKYQEFTKLCKTYKNYVDDSGYFVIPEGYFFYMGDNRTNSSDCMSYGPQKMNDNLLGKVIYKFDSKIEEDIVKLYYIELKVFYSMLFNKLEPNF